jgi:hypothetical protein
MKLFKRVCCHVRDKVKLRITNHLQWVLWLRKSIIISVLAIAPLPTFSAADEVNEVIVYGANLRFVGDFDGNFGEFLYGHSIPEQIIGFSSQQGEDEFEIDPCSSAGLNITDLMCRSENKKPLEVALDECIDEKNNDLATPKYVGASAGIGVVNANTNVSHINSGGWQVEANACWKPYELEVKKVVEKCGVSKILRASRCAAGEGEDE